MKEKGIETQKDGNNSGEGHRKRLKDRFIKSGVDAMAEHEIVELMLFYVMPRRDTKPLAKKMLESFSNLYALFEAQPAEIMRRCEVSENTAVLFSMIAQIAKSYMVSKWRPKEYVDSPDLAAEYSRALLTGKVKETFYLICLNKQKRIICAELISEGTIDSIAVSIRQIVEAAVMNQASYVIITHNHPGGSCTPSNEDFETTKLIKEALSYVEIIVTDHIIISGIDYYSFAKKGILGFTY